MRSTAMPNTLRPRRGQWYEYLDKSGTFQVVAIDPDDGLIEVQTFDGDIEESSATPGGHCSSRSSLRRTIALGRSMRSKRTMAARAGSSGLLATGVSRFRMSELH